VRQSSVLPGIIFLVVGCSARTVPVQAPAPPVPQQSAPVDSLPPLGARNNPVQGRGPFGEREYLQRLRCRDGAAPAFVRNGSVGAGMDGHILDVYSVTCRASGQSAAVYMDMYHPDVRERRAVPGFTALAELPARTAPGCPPQVGPTADSSAKYIFNYLEVETPARPLDLPAGPIEAGFATFVAVSFVVDTAGRPEPGSLVIADFVEAQARAAAQQAALKLHFTPASHHAGCLVRQGAGVQFQFK